MAAAGVRMGVRMTTAVTVARYQSKENKSVPASDRTSLLGCDRIGGAAQMGIVSGRMVVGVRGLRRVACHRRVVVSVAWEVKWDPEVTQAVVQAVE